MNIDTNRTNKQPVWIMGIIFFMNALGTVFISAIIGYVTMMMLAGKKSHFQGYSMCMPFPRELHFSFHGFPLCGGSQSRGDGGCYTQGLEIAAA